VKAVVIVGVPLRPAEPLTLRVTDAIRLGAFPAVENIAGVGLGEFVNLGAGVVVGPAVIEVSRLFSAREVLTAA